VDALGLDYNRVEVRFIGWVGGQIEGMIAAGGEGAANSDPSALAAVNG